MEPRGAIYIFGIPRVHRLTLCIWFPLHMTHLTLSGVKTRRDSTQGFQAMSIQSIVINLIYLMTLTLTSGLILVRVLHLNPVINVLKAPPPQV